jgi:hypothetical protein
MKAARAGISWLATALLLCGCQKDRAGCLTPAGDPAERTVDLAGEVAMLEVEDRVDVLWNPNGSAVHATVRAGSGLVEGIEVELTEGVLRISDRNTCHWVRDLAEVPVVVLEGVRPDSVLLMGQGDFAMTDTLQGGDLEVRGNEMAGDLNLLFSGDTLKVRMPNGIGHVTASGQAVRFRGFRSGFGDLDLRRLQANQVMLHHAGLGQATLTAQGYLFLEMASHGDAHIFGPEGDWDIRYLPGAGGTVTLHP